LALVEVSVEGIRTVVLLILSNIFMTFAWYAHLKFRDRSLISVILASWGIAFFEYCLHVPANRFGYGFFTAAQLKVLQEAITFIVFIFFSWFYLREKPTTYDQIAFGLVMLAVLISAFQPARA
jgi:uncharacterized protein